ncbi:hypothetical protein TNCV_2155541 [Trichonephila clavipes]|nr:hypothetical protein TNCV_2155541 [Trichonephila clavipes]
MYHAQFPDRRMPDHRAIISSTSEIGSSGYWSGPDMILVDEDLHASKPDLLQDVPIVLRNRMWFQHDGAPAHFSPDVRSYLNATFGVRFIGHGGLAL